MDDREFMDVDDPRCRASLVDELRALTEFISVLKGTDHDFAFAVERAEVIIRLLGSKPLAPDEVAVANLGD